MNRFVLFFLIFSTLTQTACTDAARGKFTSYGKSAKIKCISGGKVVYEDESTGKVSSEKDSDGYYFVEKSTLESIEISCETIIIRYITK